jgi:hypothetical protein
MVRKSFALAVKAGKIPENNNYVATRSPNGGFTARVYETAEDTIRCRDFLKSGVALAVAAELGTSKAQVRVPAHNWGEL